MADTGGEDGSWRALIPDGSVIGDTIVVTRAESENEDDCAGNAGPP